MQKKVRVEVTKTLNLLPAVTCPYCGNKTMMKNVLEKSVYDEELDHLGEVVGIAPFWDKFQFLECTTCIKTHVRHAEYNDWMEENQEMPLFKTIFPEQKSKVANLPDKIDKEFAAAIAVKNINSNSFGVLIGRTLEAIMDDKDAIKSQALPMRIADLTKRQIISQEIGDVARDMNALRKFGAHHDVGDLNSRDIDVLHDLTILLLEYLYDMPTRINLLKSKNSKAIVPKEKKGQDNI